MATYPLSLLSTVQRAAYFLSILQHIPLSPRRPQADRPIQRREFMLAMKTKLMFATLEDQALADIPTLKLGKSR